MPYAHDTGGGNPRGRVDPTEELIRIIQSGMPNMGGPEAIAAAQQLNGGGSGGGGFTSNVGEFLQDGVSNFLGGVKHGPRNVAPQTTMRPRPGPSVAEEQGSEMDALFQQLLGMVGGGGVDVDYEGALANSEKAIRGAYAGEIGAIRSGNRGARADTAKMRNAIERAYGQLAKTYTKSGKRAVKQGENIGNIVQGNAKESANFLDKNTDTQLSEMATQAKGLGIEDAMPAAAQPMVDNTTEEMGRITRMGTDDANRQVQFAGNNQRWMENGGQLARLEGTNKSVDLLGDLQNYLQGNRDKIAGLKGDRGRELASNESAVMGSVAGMQQAAEGDAWDRLMQMAGLKMDIDREQFDQSSTLADYQLKMLGGGGSGGSSQDSFPGAENFANAQHYLEMLNKPNRGTNVFDNFLSDQGMQDGTYQDDVGNAHKMTPYAAMAKIEQLANEQNLPQSDIELLKLAIWAQMNG